MSSAALYVLTDGRDRQQAPIRATRTDLGRIAGGSCPDTLISVFDGAIHLMLSGNRCSTTCRIDMMFILGFSYKALYGVHYGLDMIVSAAARPDWTCAAVWSSVM